MLSSGYPTDIGSILNAIAAQLVSVGEWPAERVYVSLAADEQFEGDIPAERFVVITPSDFQAMEPMVYGGGNQQLSTTGEVRVALWNRLEVDEPLNDADAMNDSTYGILGVWRTRVLAVLSMFMPADSAGNGLLMHPMRFRGWRLEPRRRKTPWMILASRWTIPFNQSLS